MSSKTLQDWFVAGYPGIFDSGEYTVWVDFTTHGAPFAVLHNGIETHFKTPLAIAAHYADGSAESIAGAWAIPSTDWYTYQLSKKKSLTDDSGGHTGVMVGFFLKMTEAQQLTVTGGEPVQDLHMTLAYLGEKAELADGDDPELSRVKSRIATFASSHAPLAATVAGYGRFTANPYDGTTPFIGLVDCPGLPQWRESLVTALRAAAYPPDATHGFTPHITLAYVPEAAPLPDVTVPNIRLSFTSLTLAIGDMRFSYPLNADAGK